MKTFQEVQTNFAVLGLAPNQSKTNRQTVVTCLTLILGTFASAIYLTFTAKTFEEIITGLHTTSTGVGLAIVFIIMISKMEKLFELMDFMEKTIDQKFENPESKAIYVDANRLVENWTRSIFLVIGKVSPVFWIFPIAISSYSVYFTTDIGNEAFKLPILWWFPFDWKNPIGYLVALTLQYITNVNCFMVVACLVAFGLGALLFILSMTTDIKRDLKLINEGAKIKNNRFPTLKRIFEFINFHSKLKECVYYSSEIFQTVSMLVCIWSLITICGVMLLIQMNIHVGDLLVLFVMIFYMSYALGSIFFMCEIGQGLENTFEEINGTMKQFDWYLFSHEVQKLLPTILIVAQEPVVLKCFGSTSALRNTFKKVIKGSFSYFMAMRHFIK